MAYDQITLLVIVVAAWLVLVTFMVWSLTRINYRITARDLRVTWCGIPIRRIRLEDIRLVSTKRVVWAEKWFNTFSPMSRWLVIHRNSGLFKHFVITPPNRFVFRENLYRARYDYLVKAGLLVPGVNQAPDKGGMADEPPPPEAPLDSVAKTLPGSAPSPS